MNRRERIQEEFMKHVIRIATTSDSSAVALENSCYRLPTDNSESHIWNVKKIKEMNLMIERAVGDDSAAKCLTALTFFDMYANENVVPDKVPEKQECDSIEVPAYTYTL